MKRYFEKMKKRWSGTSPVVYCLMILFGSSSWISVSAIWLELPLLVPKLPESWNLPSILAVLVQIAIFAPFAFGIFAKIAPKNFQPAYLIATLIALEALCMLALAFVWDITVIIKGSKHSVPLFVLFLMFSVVDCTSNVLYLPYMFVFQPQYTIAYFVGMGFSALVPTVISILQDTGRVVCDPYYMDGLQNGTVGNVTHILNSDGASHWSLVPPHIYTVPPRFSAKVYILLIFLWLCACFVAFCVLNWTRLGQKALVQKREPIELENRANEDPKAAKPEKLNKLHIPLSRYLHWLGMTFWVSFLLNGVMPPIQSYSAMPYGERTFHMSIAFSKVGNTIGCFLPFFFSIKSPWLVLCLTGVATVFAAYVMVLAVLSPNSFFVDSVAGPVLCVGAWAIFECLLAYLRTIIASILRENSKNNERRLFWCGVFTQAGSFIGAVLMFPLINVLKLFDQKPVC